MRKKPCPARGRQTGSTRGPIPVRRRAPLSRPPPSRAAPPPADIPDCPEDWDPNAVPPPSRRQLQMSPPAGAPPTQPSRDICPPSPPAQVRPQIQTGGLRLSPLANASLMTPCRPPRTQTPPPPPQSEFMSWISQVYPGGGDPLLMRPKSPVLDYSVPSRPGDYTTPPPGQRSRSPSPARVQSVDCYDEFSAPPPPRRQMAMSPPVGAQAAQSVECYDEFSAPPPPRRQMAMSPPVGARAPQAAECFDEFSAPPPPRRQMAMSPPVGAQASSPAEYFDEFSAPPPPSRQMAMSPPVGAQAAQSVECYDEFSAPPPPRRQMAMSPPVGAQAPQDIECFDEFSAPPPPRRQMAMSPPVCARAPQPADCFDEFSAPPPPSRQLQMSPVGASQASPGRSSRTPSPCPRHSRTPSPCPRGPSRTPSPCPRGPSRTPSPQLPKESELLSWITSNYPPGQDPFPMQTPLPRPRSPSPPRSPLGRSRVQSPEPCLYDEMSAPPPGRRQLQMSPLSGARPPRSPQPSPQRLDELSGAPPPGRQLMMSPPSSARPEAPCYDEFSAPPPSSRQMAMSPPTTPGFDEASIPPASTQGLLFTPMPPRQERAVLPRLKPLPSINAPKEFDVDWFDPYQKAPPPATPPAAPCPVRRNVRRRGQGFQQTMAQDTTGVLVECLPEQTSQVPQPMGQLGSPIELAPCEELPPQQSPTEPVECPIDHFLDVPYAIYETEQYDAPQAVLEAREPIDIPVADFVDIPPCPAPVSRLPPQPAPGQLINLNVNQGDMSSYSMGLAPLGLMAGDLLSEPFYQQQSIWESDPFWHDINPSDRNRYLMDFDPPSLLPPMQMPGTHQGFLRPEPVRVPSPLTPPPMPDYNLWEPQPLAGTYGRFLRDPGQFDPYGLPQREKQYKHPYPRRTGPPSPPFMRQQPLRSMMPPTPPPWPKDPIMWTYPEIPPRQAPEYIPVRTTLQMDLEALEPSRAAPAPQRFRRPSPCRARSPPIRPSSPPVGRQRQYPVSPPIASQRSSFAVPEYSRVSPPAAPQRQIPVSPPIASQRSSFAVPEYLGGSPPAAPQRQIPVSPPIASMRSSFAVPEFAGGPCPSSTTHRPVHRALQPAASFNDSPLAFELSQNLEDSKLSGVCAEAENLTVADWIRNVYPGGQDPLDLTSSMCSVVQATPRQAAMWGPSAIPPRLRAEKMARTPIQLKGHYDVDVSQSEIVVPWASPMPDPSYDVPERPLEYRSPPMESRQPSPSPPRRRYMPDYEPCYDVDLAAETPQIQWATEDESVDVVSSAGDQTDYSC